MKFSTSDLKRTFANLSLIAPRPDRVAPVFRNVHISTNQVENTATFSVRDPDTMLRIRVNLLEPETQETSLLLDFKVLKNIVESCKSTEITITPCEDSGDFGQVFDGNRMSKVRKDDAEQFPVPCPFRPAVSPVILSIKELTSAYRRTLIAVSKESYRPVFTGIDWRMIDNSTARIAATNGHLIIFHDMPITVPENNIPADLNHLLPAKVASAIVRFKPFRRYNDTVSLYCDPLGFCYVLDNIELYGVSIDGTYPDYMKAYLNPEDASYCLEFNTVEMREQFKGLYKLCDGENRKIVFSWEKREGGVLFYADGRENGGVSFIMNANIHAINPEKWGHFAPKEIAFNSHLIEEILSACEHETVKMFVFTQNQASVFDKNILLMPLRRNY